MTSQHALRALAALLLLSALGSRAAAQECAEGRIRVEGRCCWPGQSWSTELARCEGEPACPIGLVAHGETCAAAIERSGASTRGTGVTRAMYAGDATPSAASTEGWPSATSAIDPPGAWVVPVRGEDEGLISVAFAVFDVGYLMGWLGVLLDEAAGCATTWMGGATSCNSWPYAGIPLVGGIVGGMVNNSSTGGWRRSGFGVGFGSASVVLEGIGLFVMIPIAFANSTSERGYQPITLSEGVTAAVRASAPGAEAGLSLDVSF